MLDKLLGPQKEDICPNCGTPCFATDELCPSCGKNLDELFETLDVSDRYDKPAGIVNGRLPTMGLVILASMTLGVMICLSSFIVVSLGQGWLHQSTLPTVSVCVGVIEAPDLQIGIWWMRQPYAFVQWIPLGAPYTICRDLPYYLYDATWGEVAFPPTRPRSVKP